MGFTIPVRGPLGGYLGFSQYRFGCDEDVCPPRRSWVSTGFDVALRLVLGRRRIRPWIQGGLHTARVEGRVIAAGGPKKETSDRGNGLEGGVGFLIAIGERTSVSPGVRYGSLDPGFSDRGSFRMRYLVLDVGLVLGF
jgi:hypothetical protein